MRIVATEEALHGGGGEEAGGEDEERKVWRSADLLGIRPTKRHL